MEFTNVKNEISGVRLDFSAPQEMAFNEIVKDVAEFARKASKKHYNRTPLCLTYDRGIEDYDATNAYIKETVLKYTIDRLNSVGTYDAAKADKFILEAHTRDPRAESLFFAIVTQAIKAVMAREVLEEAVGFASIEDVAKENSKTWTIDSKILYNIQASSWGRNSSRYNTSLQTGVTLAPVPKSCAVNIRFHFLTIENYDFGREIAKVSNSFRAQIHAEIMYNLFNANSIFTPYYEANFAKETYILLAEMIAAINNARATAYATKTAWSTVADTVELGFQTIDERNQIGFIRNLYGVPTMVLEQAVNTASLAISGLPNWRIPNDKIVIVAADADRPIKVAMAPQVDVFTRDYKSTDYDNMAYTLTMYWDMGLITRAQVGIQGTAST